MPSVSIVGASGAAACLSPSSPTIGADAPLAPPSDGKGSARRRASGRGLVVMPR
jgi:hypothetical protein